MALHSLSEAQNQSIVWKDNIYSLFKSSLELLGCKRLLLCANLPFKRPSLGQLVTYLGRVTHKLKLIVMVECWGWTEDAWGKKQFRSLVGNTETKVHLVHHCHITLVTLMYSYTATNRCITSSPGILLSIKNKFLLSK